MYKFIFSVLSFSLSLSLHAAQKEQVDIQGSSWKVNEVKINTESERTLNYQLNDDRLVGRTIVFDKSQIISNLPEKINCQLPTYSSSEKTLDSLIHDAMGDADSANAKSYELDIKGDKIVTVINTTCGKGSFGGGDTDKNSWIALTGNHEMIVNWYDGSILTLSPLSNGATPEPSFSCSKAQSSSEKAICSDYELSSYDKSVNNSWKSAKEGAVSVGNNQQLKEIINSQKEWLKKRNACGSDKECLKNVMVNRLNVLSSITDGQ